MKTVKEHGYNRRWIRIGLLLTLTFAILLTGAFPGQARAAGKGRRIHVVFDDSGSMGSDSRWSRAMYALEVFTAMLEENDELKAYALNQRAGDAIQVSGTDSDRTNKIHQWGAGHNGINTPFRMVETAAKDLLNVKNQYSDVWLVVLTDGQFNDENNVESKLKGWNQQGIKTIYLAIGSGATELPGNPNGGGYAYTARDSADILRNVRDMANRIFERLILPANHIQKNGTTFTLNIDVPTQHIVVFAQGEGIQIGQLNASGTSKNPSEHLNVQYAKNDNYGRSDTALKGTVAIYKDQEANTFTIDVTGSQEVEFYYDPAVEVGCELKKDISDPQGIAPGSEIEEGRYFVSGAFIDPRNNAVINSDLLDSKAITLTLNNNGKTQSFGASGGEVDLEKGSVTVEAVADLKTTVLSASKTYTVVNKKADIYIPPETVMAVRQDLLKGNTSYSIIFTIIDSETKQPVDEERWNNAELEIKDQHGIRWSWTKQGMTPPQVELTPSAAGNYSDIDVGPWPFTVTVFSNNGAGSRLDTEFTFTVLPFEPFRVEDVPVSLAQKRLKKGSQEIRVHLQDPYNNDLPVTGDRWAHVTDLTVNDGDGVVWDCRRGSAEGEYILTLRSEDGKLHTVSAGTHEYTVTGTYDDGDLKNWQATGKITLTVTQEPDRQLDLKIDVPAEAYPQSRYHMKDAEPILVTAYYKGNVIDDHLWQLADEDTDFEIEVTDPDQQLAFEVTKGLKSGTWEIHPKPWNNRGYETSHGRIRFRVDLSILDDEEILYEGVSTEELEVSEEMFWCTLEWIVDNLYWIIPALLALFILSAYVLPAKKHLKTGKYELQFVYPGQHRTFKKTVRIRKEIGSVLMPYRAVRARLQCYAPSYMCEFPNLLIESVGHGQFRIRKESLTKRINLPMFSINNYTYQNVEEILSSTFTLAGFTIVTNKSLTKQGTVRVKSRRKR